MKVTLTSGMQFHYNDRLCEVISWNSRIVLTLDVLSKTEIRIPEIEVLEGIENGSIKLINEETVGNERLQSKSKDLNSYDKSEKERAEYRHKFIKGLEEEGVFGCSRECNLINN